MSLFGEEVIDISFNTYSNLSSGDLLILFQYEILFAYP